jgi:hypothetical protein
MSKTHIRVVTLEKNHTHYSAYAATPDVGFSPASAYVSAIRLVRAAMHIIRCNLTKTINGWSTLQCSCSFFFFFLLSSSGSDPNRNRLTSKTNEAYSGLLKQTNNHSMKLVHQLGLLALFACVIQHTTALDRSGSEGGDFYKKSDFVYTREDVEARIRYVLGPIDEFMDINFIQPAPAPSSLNVTDSSYDVAQGSGEELCVADAAGNCKSYWACMQDGVTSVGIVQLPRHHTELNALLACLSRTPCVNNCTTLNIPNPGQFIEKDIIMPAAMVNALYYNKLSQQEFAAIWNFYPKEVVESRCFTTSTPGSGFPNDDCNIFAYCFDGFSCVPSHEQCEIDGMCEMGQFDAEIVNTFLRFLSQKNETRSTELWTKLPKGTECTLPKKPGYGFPDDGCERDEWCIDGVENSCAKMWNQL